MIRNTSAFLNRCARPLRILALGVAVSHAALSPALAAPPANKVPATATQYAALLTRLAKSPGVSAHFVEEKFMALLKKPLRSEGELYFLPPGTLARHVAVPKPSLLILRGAQLQVKDDQGVRNVDLSRNAAVATLVQSFSYLLQGNQAELEKHYAVTLLVAGEAFTLTLVPKDPSLANLVQSLTVDGSGLELTQMVVVEKSGDRTVTSFSQVNTQKRFSAEEKARFFPEG
jgi:outer membrane lipoprotein-sorting protein